MELALFENIIGQVAPISELVALHLMGDPLVHPQLQQMLDICHNANVKVFLVTNGVLLKPDKFALLLHPCLYQVSFSLHSYFDNHPDCDGKQYLERIFSYTERALQERCDLYVNFRLWNLQQPSEGETGNTNLLHQVAERFGFDVPTELDVCQKKSFNVKNRLYMHFDTEFVWPSLELPILGTSGTCHGLGSHFGILTDGTVVPCCLDKEAAIPLGDIGQTSILEILSAAKAQAMLRGFKQHRLVEDLCQRCQYIERFGNKQAVKTL